MKTTLLIPDELMREAKAAAAKRGISLRAFVTEALAEKLHGRRAAEKPWMECVGELADLRKENARINRVIQKEFRQIRPEDRV